MERLTHTLQESASKERNAFLSSKTNSMEKQDENDLIVVGSFVNKIPHKKRKLNAEEMMCNANTEESQRKKVKFDVTPNDTELQVKADPDRQEEDQNLNTQDQCRTKTTLPEKEKRQKAKFDGTPNTTELQLNKTDTVSEKENQSLDKQDLIPRKELQCSTKTTLPEKEKERQKAKVDVTPTTKLQHNKTDTASQKENQSLKKQKKDLVIVSTDTNKKKKGVSDQLEHAKLHHNKTDPVNQEGDQNLKKHKKDIVVSTPKKSQDKEKIEHYKHVTKQQIEKHSIAKKSPIPSLDKCIELKKLKKKQRDTVNNDERKSREDVPKKTKEREDEGKKRTEDINKNKKTIPEGENSSKVAFVDLTSGKRKLNNMMDLEEEEKRKKKKREMKKDANRIDNRRQGLETRKSMIKEIDTKRIDIIRDLETIKNRIKEKFKHKGRRKSIYFYAGEQNPNKKTEKKKKEDEVKAKDHRRLEKVKKRKKRQDRKEKERHRSDEVEEKRKEATSEMGRKKVKEGNNNNIEEKRRKEKKKNKHKKNKNKNKDEFRKNNEQKKKQRRAIKKEKKKKTHQEEKAEEATPSTSDTQHMPLQHIPDEEMEGYLDSLLDKFGFNLPNISNQEEEISCTGEEGCGCSNCPVPIRISSCFTITQDNFLTLTDEEKVEDTDDTSENEFTVSISLNEETLGTIEGGEGGGVANISSIKEEEENSNTNLTSLCLCYTCKVERNSQEEHTEQDLKGHLYFGTVSCKYCDLEIRDCKVFRSINNPNSALQKCTGNLTHQHTFSEWKCDPYTYLTSNITTHLFTHDHSDTNQPNIQNMSASVVRYITTLEVLRARYPWRSAIDKCWKVVREAGMLVKRGDSGVMWTENVNKKDFTHTKEKGKEMESKADCSTRLLNTEEKADGSMAGIFTPSHQVYRPIKFDMPTHKRYLLLHYPSQEYPEECPTCNKSICSSLCTYNTLNGLITYICPFCHHHIYLIPDKNKSIIFRGHREVGSKGRKS